jgi:predicted ATPase with chaperone activity
LENIERWNASSLVLLRENMVQHSGQFLLIATTGYCPCGNYMDERKECTCSFKKVQIYQKRLGETIHACFAIEQRIQIQSFNPERRSRHEPSHVVRERVKATIELQQQRNGGRFISEISLAETQAGDSLETVQT